MSFDEISAQYDATPSRKPATSHVVVTSSANPLTGHHEATYRMPVPKGRDPAAFANAVAMKIGSSPAPFSPIIVPTATPQLTKTITQPSFVSKASSADNTEHNVQVEATPGHILGGKDGTAAGINYGTTIEPTPGGGSTVVTRKESYGKSKYRVFNPIRAGVGYFGLDPHMEKGMNEVYDASQKPDDDV